MNKVMLIGNLTNEPKTYQVTDSMTVCRFGIAVQRKLSQAQRDRGATDVDFVTISAFGKLGQVCQTYLDKGKKVFVSGRLVLESKKDPSTGNGKLYVSVTADEVEFLSPKEKMGTFDEAGGERIQQQPEVSDADWEAALPF